MRKTSSPKDKKCVGLKQTRRCKVLRNRYLKPGVLAQLRDAHLSLRSCTDMGKKRILIMGSPKVHGSSDPLLLRKSITHHTLHVQKRPKSPATPRTPRNCYSESESRLESLPLDLLVKIMCELQHDQLRAVFHVSQRIRSAVLLAKQLHFNYVTPDRSRQPVLRMKTPPAPLPKEHLFFMSAGDENGTWVSHPYTPQTPLPGLSSSSRPLVTAMREVTASLFQESSFSIKSRKPSTLPRYHCIPACSNMGSLYEEELCQAVSQNKLL